MLEGGDGNDLLIGGSGKDTLNGGPDKDSLIDWGGKYEDCHVPRNGVGHHAQVSPCAP